MITNQNRRTLAGNCYWSARTTRAQTSDHLITRSSLCCRNRVVQLHDELWVPMEDTLGSDVHRPAPRSLGSEVLTLGVFEERVRDPRRRAHEPERRPRRGWEVASEKLDAIAGSLATLSSTTAGHAR